jgi:cytochrome c-type protein NapB
VLPATRYQDLAAARPGPNAGFRTSLAGVDRVAGDLFAVAAPDQEAKLASLAQRQARRAYNGAPPVIPHAIDQRSPASCVACHQLTLRVGDIRAARMPHEHLSNCTQCHVESVARFAPPRDLPGNGFQGLPAPTQGQRAWPGAPPTIPHSTFMRSDCLSCHGPGGPEGMQSTHPWRQACQQCHAPSALLDQYAPVERAGFLLPPRIEER